MPGATRVGVPGSDLAVVAFGGVKMDYLCLCHFTFQK